MYVTIFSSILIYSIILIVIYKFYPVIKKKLLNRINEKKPQEVEFQNTKRFFNAKSKCFDCEKQINKHNKSQYNLVHPTKCFDCEKQIDKNYNKSKSNIGHSSKCFSCEG